MAQYETWSKKYDENIAGSIYTQDPSARFHYSPDFEQAKVPPADMLKYSVNIEMTGSRKKDFEAANKAAKILKTPAGYTWHHVFSEQGLKLNATGTAYVCRMQLVRSAIHKPTCAHKGSVAQWVTLNKGTPYKGVMDEDMPDQLVLPDTSPRPHCTGDNAPDEIKAYTAAGWLGGSASFFLPLGHTWVEVSQTYGVLNGEQVAFFKSCFDIYYELQRLGLYPVGEDEAGNLVMWQGGTGTHTLWYYDHEASSGEIMINSWRSLKDIFGPL